MNKPKYFLYARKSTEDDDRQVMSIEAQLFELKEYARKETLEILEEFQESKSAKTPGRPVFNEMMSKIEKNGECWGFTVASRQIGKKHYLKIQGSFFWKILVKSPTIRNLRKL